MRIPHYLQKAPSGIRYYRIEVELLGPEDYARAMGAVGRIGDMRRESTGDTWSRRLAARRCMCFRQSK